MKLKIQFLGVIAFLNVQFTFAATCEESKILDYCANPKIAENYDSQWVHNYAQDGWYMQFGNGIGRRHIAQLLLGKTFEEDVDEDYTKMCAKHRIDFSEGFLVGETHGFGNHSLFWSCHQKQNVDFCDYFSNKNETLSHSSRTYTSYFDGTDSHNVAVYVLCFDNGDIGWFVISISKKISENEEATVLEHLKSIGFNPDLRVPMYTDNCQ